MIRYEFVYVYFITTKNVGDYSYMSSPNIYYRAFFMYRLILEPLMIVLNGINIMHILLIYLNNKMA